MLVADCPCGSGERYDACCGRLHRRQAEAATAEELMRSRYAAYAVGALDHVFRTWHPRTRPESIDPDSEVTWSGLRILDRVAGGPDDDRGEVEFEATYERAGRSDRLHERSRFERRRGRWVYVDGDVSPGSRRY
ncbi:MAG TPA: YchJ family metal-binding protein [Nocardioides sp.]|uniref:YchJ family protein n=1 Tax=uncultured Nocardioides sp. TaxID=198441 RepID=UPI000EDF6EAB|nr:YchJ family metal-binding protein [uncultured Nocardioides sp.]HCB03360.1 zinc chelation protein SecC [Nocardioides sp.]HRD59936.1 YchJ family metal-binding protein [Nocardioides sp.]HRI95120.1 YchJ family metal-binding protein [Nocardioides sp.]HRK44954.1 YchJ family metal-binding protein [Nocardioides sp.]